MSKRFQWLKYLLSLTLLIGLSTPALAAPIDTAPDNGVEGYFWLCLEDNTGRRTEHAVQCCDGAFCYTCTADFKDCWISDDPQASSPTGLVFTVKIKHLPTSSLRAQFQTQAVPPAGPSRIVAVPGVGFQRQAAESRTSPPLVAVPLATETKTRFVK